MLRWPFRRRAPTPAPLAAAPDPLAFDALLALGPDLLPPGVAPDAAVRAVRAAVQAMPGAGWVSVEAHGLHVPPGAQWVEVHAPGSSATPDGRAWLELRAGIERAAAAALAGLETASGPIASEVAAPAARGFAEGVDLHAFETPAGLSRALPPAGPGQDPASSQPASDPALLGTLLGFVLPPAPHRTRGR